MTEPRIRVLSLGAGVQSTTLALMAACGELQQPDAAVMADTGWEPKAVYQHLEALIPRLPFPVHVAKAPGPSLKERLLSLETDATPGAYQTKPDFDAVPFFTAGGGQGRRQCTKEYKLMPLRDKIKELLGITGRANLPAGAVECWIGISVDEAHRMKPAREKYMTNRWPLVEMGMNRGECIEWLRTRGHEVPPKSSCLGCPYHADVHWADIRDNSPEEWEETVRIDRLLREKAAVPQFMHQARVPLDEAPLLPASREGQMDLFGNECLGLCGN